MKLFVHGILKGKVEAVKATLHNYYQFYRGFSTFKYCEGEKIEGELLEVTDEDMIDYDMIEGVANGFYHRFEVEVETEDGKYHTAWVYQQLEDKDQVLDND